MLWKSKELMSLLSYPENNLDELAKLNNKSVPAVITKVSRLNITNTTDSFLKKIINLRRFCNDCCFFEDCSQTEEMVKGCLEESDLYLTFYNVNFKDFSDNGFLSLDRCEHLYEPPII